MTTIKKGPNGSCVVGENTYPCNLFYLIARNNTITLKPLDITRETSLGTRSFNISDIEDGEGEGFEDLASARTYVEGVIFYIPEVPVEPVEPEEPEDEEPEV